MTIVVEENGVTDGSLLGIAQAVAEELGLPTPSTIIGSSDRTAVQLLRLINRSGRILAKKNWAILQVEYTFSTVDGTASYDLPSDFERLLDGSLWDRTQYWQLRGPMSPKDWQIYKSGLIANTTLRSRFRIKADTRVNKFFLDPTPTGIDSMVFEYASDQWVKTADNGSGKAAFTADTDLAIIPYELIELDVIWRMLARKGFAYAEEKREAEMQIDRAYAEDGGAPVLDMSGPRTAPDFRMNIPEGGFG